MLTDDEILDRLNTIQEFSEEHTEMWKNLVAHDLNNIRKQVVWIIKNNGEAMELKYVAALLRIVERVAEFEEIESKGKLMSDRYHSLVVVLEKDTRDDDAKHIIQSIKMIRGVLSVAPKVANIESHMAEKRARDEFGKKLIEIIYPNE